MASSPVLDLEPMLQAIAEDNASGVDLREDPSPVSSYYQIKDARNAARADERQGLFGGVIQHTEAERWRPIVQMAPKVIGAEAKDLEIASFLIEALARTDGFAGLRDGFRLARELVERFWDDVHPMPDEYGMETRVAPLSGLNGSGGQGVLLSPIARIPLTQSADHGPFATWNIDQAIEIDRLDSAKKAERIGSGGADMEEVRQAVSGTPVEFFVQTLEDIDEAIAEWNALGAALEERAGSDSPSTSNVREALESARGRIRHIAEGVLPVAMDEPEPAADAPAEADAQPGAAPAAAAAPARAPGEVATREEALKAMAQIAEFFRRTEPHSPIPFLLERAVRWGRTPLPDLLAELIPDQGARTTFNTLTGVQSPDASGDA